MQKRCFKCGELKPLSEFYKHPQMADGHLGKCKTCTKRDTRQREAEILSTPEGKAKELKRHRLKSRKYREQGRAKPVTTAYRAEVLRRHRDKHPLAAKARAAVARAVRSGKLIRRSCRVCGNKKTTAHHEDYSKPLEVEWLCVTHHAEADIKRRTRTQ